MIWRCECEADWSGDDCGVELEGVCDDGIDNDNGTKKTKKYFETIVKYFFRFTD